MDDLFENENIGLKFENMRRDWIEEYDYILIDGRTGITDIGGICTILLPDVLELFLTTNRSSLTGVVDVMRRARDRHDHLPFDRNKLVGVPVSARDESRTERQKSLSGVTYLPRSWLMCLTRGCQRTSIRWIS